MEPIELRDHLQKLHDELGAAAPSDPKSADLVAQIRQDLQRSSGLPGTAEVRDAQASLPERLEKIAVLFEVDHPTLAASSRRLMDLLGKMGL